MQGFAPHREGVGSLGEPPAPVAPVTPAFLVDGLIGRNREFNHIEHLLWAARQGAARALAMRGEPGVGKTALLHAAVARAADLTVVQLRGMPDGSPSREWPTALADLLRRSSTGDDRRGVDLSGPAADALHAIAQTARRPLVITVDDCHLLPATFVAALARAVSSGHVKASLAMLLAWRDLPLTPRFELGVAELPEHVLGPIDFDGAQVLLGQLGAAGPDPSVLKQLVRQTAGNPFALLETCSNLSTDALNGMRELPMPVPVGNAVASAFGSCLEPFDEECREVVGASATGAPLPILTTALRSLDLDLDQLGAAQATGLVTVRHHRIDFPHPLVRAAAFQLLDEDERDEIHLAIASAYSQRGFVERAAFHASQIHRRPDQQVALLSSHAARVALDRGDRTRAAVYDEVAAEFADSDEEAAVHLAQAATLWVSAGQGRRVTVCLERSERLHQVSPSTRAELDYQRARAEFAATGDLRTTDRMVAAAELCASASPARAVLMLADAAACRLVLSQPEDSVTLAQRARDLSRGVSSHTEVLAETTLAIASLFEGHPTAGQNRRPQAIAILLGQAQGFPGSPYLALLIGEGLMLDGYWTLAGRWSHWIDRCASTTGDQALSVVPDLLSATAILERGSPVDARRHAQRASELAVAHGDHQMAARALSLLTAALAASGEQSAGFESAARLFSLQGASGRGARMRSSLALANLELQRGRRPAAVAWLRSALDEVRPPDGLQSPGTDTIGLSCLPAIAEGLLLARREEELGQALAILKESTRPGRSLPVLCEWASALAASDLEATRACYERVRRATQGLPVLAGRVRLAFGVRLAAGGEAEAAQAVLNEARATFASLGAAGWEALTERELGLLEGPVAPAAATLAWRSPSAPNGRASGTPEAPDHDGAARTSAAWEIQLLGGFSVRRDGEPVQLPLGLAAQGLKVVALKQRILAEELVELLWPEAGPGVGIRRLRNVLWRVRAACGELLRRDGNFITLAEGAEVDVDAFRHGATLALERDTPVEKATELARRALRLYCGELLPGDRYADWAAGPREALCRIQVELLEFLLSVALDKGDLAQGVVLLNQLIEADPYEEHYRLQLAELHAHGGNRTRALTVLEQAEQMLSELGLPASPALLRIRGSLNGPLAEGVAGAAGAHPR